MVQPAPLESKLVTYGLALATVLLTSLPMIVNIDSEERYLALNDLLKSGTIRDTKYSLIGPLFATPLWLLGRVFGDPHGSVWFFNKLVLFAGAGGLWWALRPVLSANVCRRFLLYLAFASMVPYHLMYFGGEVFTAMCVGFGTAAVAIRRVWWGWIPVVLGVANVPATAAGLAFAVGVLCWYRRRLRYGLAVAAAIGLILAENTLRRGSPLAGGYSGDHGAATALPYSGLPGFSYPFFFGLLSILFSFGKGLLFFVLGMFVPFGKKVDGDANSDPDADLRVLYRVWLGFVIGLVLVYAKWWAWYGGLFWGPRFFLFACLPASLVLARRASPPFSERLGMNALLFAVAALACWVGANGVVFHQYGDVLFSGPDYSLEYVAWYVPECSPLWQPFVNPSSLTIPDRLWLLGFGMGAIVLLLPLGTTVVKQLKGIRGWSWFRFRF